MLKDSKTWFLAISVLSIVGIILATYLLYSFYNPKPALFCDINDRINCQAVVNGSLATIAGVPVSLVGLIGYAFLLFAGLTYRKKLACAVSAFGMVFCLRLTILEIFFIKVLCPICIACQVIMLLIFIISSFLVFGFGRKVLEK